MAPSQIHSHSRRTPSLEWPWLPICVATLCLRAASASRRASSTRVGQRLLAVDVLAALDRRHRDDGVHVVGRADDDRVDVLLLVEHLAEVLVPLRLGNFVEDLGGGVQSTSHSATMFSVSHGRVVRPHAADADAGDVQLVARGGLVGALPAQHVPRDDRESRRESGGAARKLLRGTAGVRWNQGCRVVHQVLRTSTWGIAFSWGADAMGFTGDGGRDDARPVRVARRRASGRVALARPGVKAGQARARRAGSTTSLLPCSSLTSSRGVSKSYGLPRTSSVPLPSRSAIFVLVEADAASDHHRLEATLAVAEQHLQARVRVPGRRGASRR